MPLSDNEIIEKIRGGAKHHYAVLVDRYKDKAFTLAVRMLHNREDAEEAAQDAFIRAYNALNKFEGKARFGTWFYRILYNVCLTKLGKRKEDFQSVEFDENLEYDSPDYKIGNFDETEIDTKDMISFMKRTIETLPDKYQTILSLFYFQELSHEEIGEITQLPLGTIKTHLFRARLMLQQRMQKEFEKTVWTI